MKSKSIIVAFFIAIIAGVGGGLSLPLPFSPLSKSNSQYSAISPPYAILADLIENQSYFSHFEAEHLARLIWEESRGFKIDPFYVLAIIKVESSFDPEAISPKGAVGLMQLLPSTAHEMSVKAGMNFSEKECATLLKNPYFNVKMGIMYFATLLRTLENRKLATLAYFWGMGNVKKFLLASYFPSDAYLQKVLQSYNTSFQYFIQFAKREN